MMKSSPIKLFAAAVIIVIAVACGSDDASIEPTNTAVASPTATRVPSRGPIGAQTPAARPTAVFDVFGADPFSLLDIRRLPDALADATSATGEEVTQAWTGLFSDSLLLNDTLDPLIVTCADGTGLLHGAIPDDPKLEKYADTGFEWEITRSAADSSTSASIVLTFSPPLDQQLWDAMGTRARQSAVGTGRDTSQWKTNLSILNGKIRHGLSPRQTAYSFGTGDPSAQFDNLAVATNTNLCDDRGSA